MKPTPEDEWPGRTVRPTISFDSPWFYGALTCFVIAVAIGIAGRLHGRLVLPDPAKIYHAELRRSPWEFRKDSLYHAGQHFARNANAIRVKGNLSIAMMLLLGLEISALVIWIAR